MKYACASSGAAVYAKLINEAMLKILRKHKKDSLEYVAGYMWWSAIDEIFTIFGDFATEQHARSYYASIRFCMEAVSDLKPLCKNPRGLSSFMTDGEEIKQKLNHLKKTYTSKKELDAERNKLLLKERLIAK